MKFQWLASRYARRDVSNVPGQKEAAHLNDEIDSERDKNHAISRFGYGLVALDERRLAEADEMRRVTSGPADPSTSMYQRVTRKGVDASGGTEKSDSIPESNSQTR
jgi:hypothetical protein